jgi:hypothetical protein
MFTPHHKRDPDKKEREKWDRQHLAHDGATGCTSAMGLLFVVASTIIAGGSLLVSYRQTQIGEKQAQISEAQTRVMQEQTAATEAQQRPWITAEPTEHKISLGKRQFGASELRLSDGADISLEFRLKNVGQAVAQGIDLKVELVAVAGRFNLEGIERVRVTQEKLCSDLSGPDYFKPGENGFTLFPNEQKNEIETLNVSKKDFVPESGEKTTPKSINLIAVGCVDYRFYINNKHHQTRFAYEISPNEDFKHDFPVGGRSIPWEKLHVEKYNWGNGAAD